MRIPRTLTVHKTRKIGTIDATVMVVARDNKTDQWENLIARIDQEGKADRDAEKVAAATSLALIVVANGNSIGECLSCFCTCPKSSQKKIMNFFPAIFLLLFFHPLPPSSFSACVKSRQSGSDKTGVKAVDKRDGGGAHNWGSHKQDLDDLNKGTDQYLTDGEKNDSAVEGETKEGETNAEGEAKPVEEEVKEMTLDEWKAQRAAIRAKPQYNLRKAGEGEDTAQWTKMIPLDKKKVNYAKFYHFFLN